MSTASSMADYMKEALLLLVTPKCYDEYFVNFNFLDVPCFKSTISKALGFTIIAGSIMVKVPQIMKILNAKSAAGISLLSVLLDLFAITSSVSYSFIKNFPFSAWGDGLFLALQTATIATLVLHYNKSAAHGAIFVALYSGLVYLLTGGSTPEDVLWSLQAANVPFIVIGKSLQVIANYRNGSTGQLSAATGFMLFFGSLARIFTSVQETGDSLLILTYVSAFSVNAVVAGQLVYYWNVKPTHSKGEKQSSTGAKKKQRQQQRAKKD